MNIPCFLRLQKYAAAVLSIAFLMLNSAAVYAEKSQEVRPALLGHGPQSLINVLSVERMMKKGQKDGVVKFDFYVNHFGQAGGAMTWGGSEGSEVLARELVDQIERARFVPASYHGEEVGSFLDGTLVLATSGGKPRLRIFLNQEQEHLSRGDDFIAPQQIFPRNDKFKHYDDSDYRLSSNLIAIRIDTDVNGKISDAKLLRVHPPGSATGLEVMKNIKTASMSPGYLNGRPIACSTTWTIPLQSYGHNDRWISQVRPREKNPAAARRIASGKPAKAQKLSS